MFVSVIQYVVCIGKSVVECKKSDKWACLPFFHEQDVGQKKKKRSVKRCMKFLLCGFSFLSQTGRCFNDQTIEHKRAVNSCAANSEIVKRKIVIIVVQVG